MAADGGFSRVVWIPSDLKEQLRSFIPPDLFDKIATEKLVKSIDELKQYLSDHVHPVCDRWKETGLTSYPDVVSDGPVFSAGEFPITSGGFKITLKNARIYADRVTIQPIKPKSPKKG
jgi:acetyl-CoA decarbonylase/synthase complex subunit beta